MGGLYAQAEALHYDFAKAVTTSNNFAGMEPSSSNNNQLNVMKTKNLDSFCLPPLPPLPPSLAFYNGGGRESSVGSDGGRISESSSGGASDRTNTNRNFIDNNNNVHSMNIRNKNISNVFNHSNEKNLNSKFNCNATEKKNENDTISNINDNRTNTKNDINDKDTMNNLPKANTHESLKENLINKNPSQEYDKNKSNPTSIRNSLTDTNNEKYANCHEKNKIFDSYNKFSGYEERPYPFNNIIDTDGNIRSNARMVNENFVKNVNYNQLKSNQSIDDKNGPNENILDSVDMRNDKNIELPNKQTNENGSSHKSETFLNKFNKNDVYKNNNLKNIPDNERFLSKQNFLNDSIQNGARNNKSMPTNPERPVNTNNNNINSNNNKNNNLNIASNSLTPNTFPQPILSAATSIPSSPSSRASSYEAKNIDGDEEEEEEENDNDKLNMMEKQQPKSQLHQPSLNYSPSSFVYNQQQHPNAFSIQTSIFPNNDDNNESSSSSRVPGLPSNYTNLNCSSLIQSPILENQSPISNLHLEQPHQPQQSQQTHFRSFGFGSGNNSALHFHHHHQQQQQLLQQHQQQQQQHFYHQSLSSHPFHNHHPHQQPSSMIPQILLPSSHHLPIHHQNSSCFGMMNDSLMMGESMMGGGIGSALMAGTCNPSQGQNQAVDYDTRELEAFAEHFKQRRIKIGVTQADVGSALGKLKIPGVGSLSQSTICRFESLTLSHNNMVALKPVLQAWLEEAEKSARESRMRTELFGSGVGNAGGLLSEKKRKRTSIAAPEKRSLEAYFAIQPRPSGEKIAQIADKLDLKKNVVRVWFCNQRQKQKRMKFSAVGVQGAH